MFYGSNSFSWSDASRYFLITFAFTISTCPSEPWLEEMPGRFVVSGWFNMLITCNVSIRIEVIMHSVA